MKKRFLHLSFVFVFLFSQSASSQNIRNAEIGATPLSVNPAFTGMFDGNVRVNASYDNQWTSVTVPYISYGVSADMPVFRSSKGNYLAVGFQYHKDQAGDGNLSNSNTLVSAAYHMLFRNNSDSNGYHTSDLAFGLQAGYNSNSIDLSEMYFGHYPAPEFYPFPLYNIPNSVSYYSINAGICFSHNVGQHLSYTAGIAAYNLNEAYNNPDNTQYRNYGNDRHYTAEIGADWQLSGRFALRPEVLYQSQWNASGVIAGNEFRCNVSKYPHSFNPTSVFIGGWYRTGETAVITAGVEVKRFRFGLSYDYNVGSFNTASNGQGGLAVSLKYIAPGHGSWSKNRVTPKSSF